MYIKRYTVHVQIAWKEYYKRLDWEFDLSSFLVKGEFQYSLIWSLEYIFSAQIFFVSRRFWSLYRVVSQMWKYKLANQLRGTHFTPPKRKVIIFRKGIFDSIKHASVRYKNLLFVKGTQMPIWKSPYLF